MTNRVTRLNSLLTEGQSFLVTKPANIRYLCGYSGSNGILLVETSAAKLFTDSRYAIQANQECFDVEVVIANDIYEEAAKHFAGVELLIEDAHLSVAIFSRLTQLVNPKQVTKTTVFVESLRAVKDSAELETISTACKIATTALSNIQPQIQIGQTELEICRMLEAEMIAVGADSIAFESIVATGPNSAIAHHQPTHRPLEKGDLLKIDFGAKVSGYHSDCTRTFIAGAPQDWQTEIFQAVKSAQQGSREVLTAGVLASDVVAPTLTQFEQSGLLDRFGHGLGHGVGLEIHEDPFLSRTLTTKLEAGTVVTIEPGLYLPDLGGVRIEDTVVITDSGYTNLTDLPYELMQVG
ncbi:MAG: Xaa-Pro peptidase family protein [Actinomycetales bacterium]|nr:Xaa-Pro peptidase family protein [Actinomycetales bacterium]